MRRLVILVLAVFFIVILCTSPVSALTGSVSSASSVDPPVITIKPGALESPQMPSPLFPSNLLPQSNISVTIKPEMLNQAPINIAFSVVSNRYTAVDPNTTFDLNGDLVGDISIGTTEITGKNGTTVQLLEPAALNLDQVQSVPSAGYTAASPTVLSRVYAAKLPGGGYAKFMVLQSSPKVTVWFHYGQPTTSVLKANGQSSHAVLTWDALPDAALGYNIYRYEFLDNNAYSVTLLNDLTVKETTFTDNTADNHYYLYVVIAIKNGGSFGSSTTVAPVQIQSLQHNLVISLNPVAAKLDGSPISLAVSPVIKNGRLMIPSSLLNSAGVKMTFDAASQKLTLSRRLDNVTYTIVMTIDAPDYTWNGTAYKADVPPYLIGSQIMVPLRVVAPALAYGLSFNSADRQAVIQWFE